MWEGVHGMWAGEAGAEVGTAGLGLKYGVGFVLQGLL